MTKLSVVIICWNDADCILDCIQSVYAETASIPFEIVLVDNGSTDDSIAQVRKNFPQVRIVGNGRNLGFGPGYNPGFKFATGEFILILNPDTIVHDNALEKLVAFAER